MAGDPEDLADAIGDAEVIDVITDALGDWVKVGVLGDAVLIGVSGSPAILDTPERRGQFAKAWTEAERRAEAHVPEPEVMKLVRKNFFDANPDAAEDDWRRYCELIGPGVAEKYAGQAARDATPEGCDSMEFGGSPPSMVDGHCRCLVCGRCGHHTGNSHQGHYWKWCKVTQSMREFHFCCPDEEHGCELEARAKAEPYRRPCCDHCNNLAGDPDGHDYGDETAHDGPCEQCAAEQD